MALKVVTAKGGLQGSTYNPQQTAPAATVQNATTKPIQGSTYNPQQTAPAKVLQPAATNVPNAAQIAAIAAQQRAAAEAAAAAARQVIRVNFQNNLNSKVQAQTTKLKVSVAAPQTQMKITGFGTPKLPKIIVPDRPKETDYDKAYREAMDEFNKQRKPAKTGFLGTAWDKVSFGQDRRDAAAREFADKRVKELMGKDFKAYENRVNAYIKKQAEAQAAINRAATTMTSQAEFDKYVAGIQKSIDNEYAALQSLATSYEGKTKAFSDASQKPLTSLASRVVSKGVKLLQTDNPWFKYTLGQGSKNAPSVVTALGRASNFIGNLTGGYDTVYKTGGKQEKVIKGGVAGWQQTFNQRNANAKPWVDIDDKKANEMFGDSVRNLIKTRKQIGETDAAKLDFNKVLRGYKDSYNQEHKFYNSAIETIADPLNFVGGSLGKGIAKALPKLEKTQFVSKLTNTKLYKSLTAEAKTPEETLRDAIAAAKNKQDELHSKLVPQINELNKHLNGTDRLDVSVFDDLAGLTDFESAILQRTSATGKLAGRDALRLAGQKATRQRIETVAAKWVDFSQKMADTDKVIGSSKRIYTPNTTWVRKGDKSLDDYNFRLRKTGKNIKQSSADFHRSAIDRYFKSSVDDGFAETASVNRAARTAKRDALVKQYDDALEPLRADVQKKYDKTRTLRARTARAIRGVTPNAIWKKAVLKYRPAWYVNNLGYNVQAAGLAGGPAAIAEHVKMLSPVYRRKAMHDVPGSIRSKLAKEAGGGRLGRFAAGLENYSRVAAFRGAKRAGHTDEQALKRVNDYLFDYTTKNWERPLKAAIPFWSFQKNLMKASARMPFDRPLAANAYNRVDRYQDQQFNQDFDKTIPELKKLGYSDDEIEQFRADNAKYFKGKLKIGGKYFNTPFNAFSDRGMSQFGINPYLSVGREVADSVDSFGRPVKGKKGSFLSRLISKFPQADLATQAKDFFDVQRGRLKPTENYIGKPGSEGYGLGKSKQGFDSTKSNYVRSMDPRAGFKQNLLAFAGVPRSMEFDKGDFVHGKMLQKVSETYFNTDWHAMEWDEQQKQQKALFKKFGITADEFYKGVLSKFDTDNTKRIKGMKEEARAKTQSLLDEYSKQPAGTRNMWAAQKLRELNDQHYFDENPFLYTFKWMNPTSVAKSDRQAAYLKASKSGDWSEWRARYGDSRKQSPFQAGGKFFKTKELMDKYLAVQHATATGDWSAYRAKYGTKATPYKYGDKFFKSQESMDRYKEGEFWDKFGKSSKSVQQQLLADNPQYDTRKDWTAADWNKWRRDRKSKLIASTAGFGNITARTAVNLAKENTKAIQFKSKQKRVRKVVFA